MNKRMINQINNLCENNPYEYLLKSSKWFHNKLVNVDKEQCYPYYEEHASEYDKFFSDDDISPFEKDVGLKFMVNRDMQDKSKNLVEISKWIIKTWGGIKGIGDETVKVIVDRLPEHIYLFDNIPSWSKVYSFNNIDKYIIYDSRVIYTINWLLLTINATDNKIEANFFPQPPSRNKKLASFPVDSIINFKYSDLIQHDKRGEKRIENIYYSKKEAYERYITLIDDIREDLWADLTLKIPLVDEEIYLRNYPFFTEMLLFNMSDDIIFDDIIKKVSINIKT